MHLRLKAFLIITSVCLSIFANADDTEGGVFIRRGDELYWNPRENINPWVPLNTIPPLLIKDLTTDALSEVTPQDHANIIKNSVTEVVKGHRYPASYISELSNLLVRRFKAKNLTPSQARFEISLLISQYNFEAYLRNGIGIRYSLPATNTQEIERLAYSVVAKNKLKNGYIAHHQSTTGPFFDSDGNRLTALNISSNKDIKFAISLVRELYDTQIQNGLNEEQALEAATKIMEQNPQNPKDNLQYFKAGGPKTSVPHTPPSRFAIPQSACSTYLRLFHDL